MLDKRCVKMNVLAWEEYETETGKIKVLNQIPTVRECKSMEEFLDILGVEGEEIIL
jgi:hypothetical protein